MPEQPEGPEQGDAAGYEQAAALQAAFMAAQAEAAPERRQPQTPFDIQTEMPKYQPPGSPGRAAYDQEMATLTGRYSQEFPTEQETITGLVTIPDMVQAQERLVTLRRQHSGTTADEEQALARYLGECHYLYTHLMVANRDKPDQTSKFWKAANEIVNHLPHGSDKIPMTRQARAKAAKSATIYNILTDLGQAPQLVHPAQASGGATEVAVTGPEGPRYYSVAKVSTQAGMRITRRTGEHYTVQIPKSKLDLANGQASQRLAQEVGACLASPPAPANDRAEPVISSEAVKPTTVFDLQHEMPAYARLGDPRRQTYESALQQLTQKYSREFPDQLELVTILASIPDMVENQRRASLETLSHAERKGIFRQLTEYQYLYTHFAITHKDQPGAITRLWKTARRIAETLPRGKVAVRLVDHQRKGAHTAAAAYQVFESLGLKPRLSHPDEDAYESIDLWLGEDQNAVQLKGGRGDEVIIEKTDQIEFPGVEVPDKTVTRHYSLRGEDQLARFRMGIGQYAARTGRAVEGYFISIPSSMIDAKTGRPRPGLEETVRRLLHDETAGTVEE